MWILRWIWIAIIILAVIFFSVQNAQEAEVQFLQWKSSVPLFYVIFFSFAAGLAAFLMIAVYHQLRMQLKLARRSGEIKKLTAQLEGRDLEHGETLDKLKREWEAERSELEDEVKDLRREILLLKNDHRASRDDDDPDEIPSE